MNERTIDEWILLCLPVLSFWDEKLVYTQTPFLLGALVLFLMYFVFTHEPYENVLGEKVRRMTGLLCCSWLTLILIGELAHIITDIYTLSYSSELLLFIKMILMLTNLEIGFSLKRPV